MHPFGAEEWRSSYCTIQIRRVGQRRKQLDKRLIEISFPGFKFIVGQTHRDHGQPVIVRAGIGDVWVQQPQLRCSVSRQWQVSIVGKVGEPVAERRLRRQAGEPSNLGIAAVRTDNEASTNLKRLPR